LSISIENYNIIPTLYQASEIAEVIPEILNIFRVLAKKEFF